MFAFPIFSFYNHLFTRSTLLISGCFGISLTTRLSRLNRYLQTCATAKARRNQQDKSTLLKVNMESEPKIPNKNVVKKSFSAPIKKPNATNIPEEFSQEHIGSDKRKAKTAKCMLTDENASSKKCNVTNILEECGKEQIKSGIIKSEKTKCVKKDENNLEWRKDIIEKPTSKPPENCSLTEITQSKQKSSFKQEKRKRVIKQPKQLSDCDYAEIFRNVIKVTEINNIEITRKNDSPLKTKFLNELPMTNKMENIIVDVVDDKINERNVKESHEKDASSNELDSVVSDDIDKWDNLSFCVQEKNETTPDIKSKTFKDVTAAKKKVDKQNKLSPQQLLFTDSELSTKKSSKLGELEIDAADINISKKKNDSEVPKLKRETKNRKSNLKANKKNKSCVQGKDSDSENTCCSEPEEKGTWVQCSNSECNKWRYLQDVEDPQLVPEKWECKMNSDLEHNSCDLPEVEYDESEHIFTKYTLGSVVWAKMDGYPWWPAMIDNDPDYKVYFEIPTEDCMIPSFFHVTFFGTSATRAWIKPAHISPYVKNEPKLKSSIVNKKEVTAAIKLADSALDMTLKERLDKYGFVSNFAKKCKNHKKSSSDLKLCSSNRKCSKVEKMFKEKDMTLSTCLSENDSKSADNTHLSDESLNLFSDELLKVVSRDKNSIKTCKKKDIVRTESSISTKSVQEKEIQLKDSEVQDSVKPLTQEEQENFFSNNNAKGEILNVSVERNLSNNSSIHCSVSNDSKICNDTKINNYDSEISIIDSKMSNNDSMASNILTSHLKNNREIENNNLPKECKIRKETNTKRKITTNKVCVEKKNKISKDVHSKQSNSIDVEAGDLQKTKSESKDNSKPLLAKKIEITANAEKENLCLNIMVNISDNNFNTSEQEKNFEAKKERHKTKISKQTKLKLKNISQCKSGEEMHQEKSDSTIKTEQASVANLNTNRKLKNNNAIKAFVNKKQKMIEDERSHDLILSKPYLETKSKKKKNAFSVPVPKNSQNLSVENSSLVSIPSSHENKPITNSEDDSHLVPDINLTLISDVTNEEELELKNDLEQAFLKNRVENKHKCLGNVEMLNINCLDNKRILSDDESSDFILDIETEDENKAFVETLDEVHGKFGGRCFEHESDSDPLDLIED